jgi:ATP-binding cassette subfamily C protein CydC
MLTNARYVLAIGRSRHVARTLLGSLVLGLSAGAASVALLALSGWFIAMSALAGAGLAVGFSFFYPSAGVQALAFGRTVLRYLERLVGHGATLRLDATLRESVFATALAPGSRHSGAKATGVLLHTVTSDAEVAEASLLRVLAPTVTYVGVSVGSCCVIATVSLALALIVAFGTAAVALAVILPAWVSSLEPGRRLAQAEMEARQEITDALDGMDELLSFGAVALGAGRVERSLSHLETAQRRLRGVVVTATALRLAVVGITVLFVSALASGSLGHQPVSVASAAAIALASLGILQLSEPLGTAAQEFGRNREVWARLGQVLAVPPVPTVVADRHDDEPRGSIRAQGLKVDRGRGVIIDNLNLQAAPGDTVIVTGRSGSGKSSLLAALSGQIQVQAGKIQSSGKVVRLPQHPYVVRGTVADNLRIAEPGISNERMEEALVTVGLNDVLGRSGLDTYVGSGGRALSGGQMRRLSIAQALLSRADVILGDEPTEGLDSTSARELLLALRLSDPWLTLVLAMHDQRVSELSWVPDAVIRLPVELRRSHSDALETR